MCKVKLRNARAVSAESVKRHLSLSFGRRMLR